MVIFHEGLWWFNEIVHGIYPLVMKDPPFSSWENPLFLWPFSIAMLVYQRLKDY